MFDLDLPEIDLNFFKNWVRIDHDLDDAELTLCLLSAKSNVSNIIGEQITEDSDPELMIVILNLASYYYYNKTMTTNKNFVPDNIYNSILSMHNTKII